MVTPAVTSYATKASQFAPPGAVLSPIAIDRLADFVTKAGGQLVALTGAGCSTESGVPDYRSPAGSYSKGHKPMQHSQFVTSESQRSRYWARSLVGWRYFSDARPNSTHRALASLEKASLLSGLITQNVDGLHTQAGTRSIVELHGCNDEVVCRSCGSREPRKGFQEELERVNADWMREFLPSRPESEDIRADGDAHLLHEDFRDFRVPGCRKCGGVMMPNVIFFGGSLQPEVKENAQALVDSANALLIAGTSCQVFSAFRLVQVAHRSGKPVAIVNVGPTRADNLVPEEWRFLVRTGEALPQLCQRLGIPL